MKEAIATQIEKNNMRLYAKLRNIVTRRSQSTQKSIEFDLVEKQQRHKSGLRDASAKKIR